ncbi:MAG TPA: hypothetical protein VFP96_13060 [Candidatus Acidoferrum sp.]|nr:hypothetical protein [Candidatus Acidoferrum sp.]
MNKFFIALFVLCWSAAVVPAQELPPTIRILPEDIVQTSIKQRPSPGVTNKVAVFWQYTETGARKMLAFWRAHAGKEVVEQIGDFECHPTLSTNKPPNWTEEGWLKSRTDKFFAVSEEDAKKIIAGFQGK